MAIRRRSRSSPVSISRLASSPTTRKKNVIRPLLTQCRRSCEIPECPTWIESFVVQTDSYELDQGEFAHRSAATAAHNSTTALPVSVLRKSRTGEARFRDQAVRPVNVAGAPAEAFMRDTVGAMGDGGAGGAARLGGSGRGQDSRRAHVPRRANRPGGG